MNRGGVETWLMHVLRHIDREKFHLDFLVHTDQPAAYDAELLALGSRILCLAQTFQDFEVIVVDDASREDSAVVVSSYADPRLTLVRHERNRGECPARNTGVAHSRGEWIVTTDSDDALLPGCLSAMRKHIEGAPVSARRLGFMYSMGNGSTAPHPAPQYALLDYVGWLRFINTRDDTNILWCTSRSTFDSVRFPDSTVTPLEWGFAFAKRFETLLVPEILASIYVDADNRLTASRAPRDEERTLTRANDYVASATRMLQEHGSALRDYAPRYHETILRELTVSYFTIGRRREGLRHAAAYLNQCGLTTAGLASIGLAAVSPKAFLDLRDRRDFRRAMNPS
jgi:glycosyltransferase involved in cell wall biosynthesis